MAIQEQLLTPRNALNAAQEALNVAYWTRHDYHIKEARGKIMAAICGQHNASFDDLVEFIEEAALDSVDLDMTQKDAASAVARALLKALAPDLIEEPAKETA